MGVAGGDPTSADALDEKARHRSPVSGSTRFLLGQDCQEERKERRSEKSR